MRPCPLVVWTKKGGARGGARGGEQRGLVGFDLQEAVASFFHDDARGFFLAVERVGGDGFAVERGQGGEELLGDFQFAALGVLLLIHDGAGDGRAVFDFDQADHADDVADHFPVQGERAGQRAGLRAEPAAEQRGEGLGVHAREHFVKDVVAGHLVKCDWWALADDWRPVATHQPPVTALPPTATRSPSPHRSSRHSACLRPRTSCGIRAPRECRRQHLELEGAVGQVFQRRHGDIKCDR